LGKKILKATQYYIPKNNKIYKKKNYSIKRTSRSKR